MLDMQKQAQLKNAALKASGGSEVKLTVTVEADARCFTVPRLDQGDWDKTVAIVIDTDMKATEIAEIMNAAAAAAHALDDTRPATYFEEWSGENASTSSIGQTSLVQMLTKVEDYAAALTFSSGTSVCGYIIGTCALGHGRAKRSALSSAAAGCS